MEATLLFQQMTYIDAYVNFISVTCSPHNVKTTIGQYQHTIWAKRPIIDRYRLSADYRCISNCTGHVSMVCACVWPCWCLSSSRWIPFRYTCLYMCPFQCRISGIFIHPFIINLACKRAYHFNSVIFSIKEWFRVII